MSWVAKHIIQEAAITKPSQHQALDLLGRTTRIRRYQEFVIIYFICSTH
jgi:hypothetical protein